MSFLYTIERGTIVPSALFALTSAESTPEKSTGDGGASFGSTVLPVFGPYVYQRGGFVQDVICRIAPSRRGSVVTAEMPPANGTAWFSSPPPPHAMPPTRPCRVTTSL